jgi:hypothetical protein
VEEYAMHVLATPVASASGHQMARDLHRFFVRSAV